MEVEDGLRTKTSRIRVSMDLGARHGSIGVEERKE